MAVVGVVMGSQSDLPVMDKALQALEEFGIPYAVKILSAHRTLDETVAGPGSSRGGGDNRWGWARGSPSWGCGVQWPSQ